MTQQCSSQHQTEEILRKKRMNSLNRRKRCVGENANFTRIETYNVCPNANFKLCWSILGDSVGQRPGNTGHSGTLAMISIK